MKNSITKATKEIQYKIHLESKFIIQHKMDMKKINWAIKCCIKEFNNNSSFHYETYFQYDHYPVIVATEDKYIKTSEEMPYWWYSFTTLPLQEIKLCTKIPTKDGDYFIIGFLNILKSVEEKD